MKKLLYKNNSEMLYLFRPFLLSLLFLSIVWLQTFFGCHNVDEGEDEDCGQLLLPFPTQLFHGRSILSCEEGAQVLHGDQVVELSVQLEVQEVEGREEDREGQVEVEEVKVELKVKRTCTWMTSDETQT